MGGKKTSEAEIYYRTVQSSYRDCLIVKVLYLFLCDFQGMCKEQIQLRLILLFISVV